MHDSDDTDLTEKSSSMLSREDFARIRSSESGLAGSVTQETVTGGLREIIGPSTWRLRSFVAKLFSYLSGSEFELRMFSCLLHAW